MTRMIWRVVAAVGMMIVSVMPILAQNSWETPGGSRAPGGVMMCLNSQGQAVPVDQSGACPSGGGGGGGVTIADGADATKGAKADSACASDIATCTLISLVKRLNQSITTLIAAVTSSIPAGTFRIGYTSDDPCANLIKIPIPISQATSTQIISGTSAQKIYVCSFALISSPGENVNLIEGTGSVCATGSTAMLGSTTAANGLSIPANGGLTHGSGAGTVAGAVATPADNVCLTQSGTARVSGVLSYVKQ